MFPRCEVIIFATDMLFRGYFLLTGSILILGWTAVLLGFNMPFTWFVHRSGNILWDDFFIHFSWLGEWALIFIALSIALITHWKKGLWMSATLGIQAATVASIKIAINAPRPIEINASWVRQIDKLDIHHWQSFPSGHTAVGFYTLGLIAQIYPGNTKHSLVLLMVLSVLALTMGYSRMYLAQHSLQDVCAGGSIALFFLWAGHASGKKLKIHD